MKIHTIGKGYPKISYIVNNWPKTKDILKKFIISNHQKPDLFFLTIYCLKELRVYKVKRYSSLLKKITNICSRNVYFNTYHDHHHFKSVLIVSCILAKQVNLKYKDRVLLAIIALTHDMNHQGRRVLITEPYYQENKSYNDLKRILFKKILSNKELHRIKRIFQSTFFPIKPKNVVDDLEKIILDADILSSLMFGPDIGIKLARRLKQEIRYNDETETLFKNFLKLLGDKSLYLDFSKKSC